MNTKTYAKLLENQGYYHDALEVYKNLQKTHHDKEIEQTIKKYEKVNLKVLEFFVRMEESQDYHKLERWLSKCN